MTTNDRTNPLAPVRESVAIQAAQMGGFVVLGLGPAIFQDQYHRAPMFAGTLTECLSFVSAYFEPSAVADGIEPGTVRSVKG